MPTKIRRPDEQRISVEPLTPAGFAPFGTVIQNPAKASFPTPLPSVAANQGSATKYPDVSPLVSSYELAKSSQPALPRMSMFSCKPRPLRRNRQGQQVFDVSILERHPFTPQTFVPTGLAANDQDTAYLVIVAPTVPLTEAEAIQDHFKSVPKPRPSLKERLLGGEGNPLAMGEHKLRTTPSSQPVSDSIARSTSTPKSPGPPDLNRIKAFIARGDQAVTYGAGTWHAPMVVLGKQTIDFVVVQYMNGVALEDCQEVELHDGSLDVIVDEDLIKRSQPLAKL